MEVSIFIVHNVIELLNFLCNIADEITVNTCCDKDMIKTMDKSLSKAEGVFKRCPTCFENLLQSICSFTCSPDQSDFIDVIDTKTNETSK